MSLDELVKVDAQKLRRNAQVATEVETLREIHHAVAALGILKVNGQL